MKPRPRRNDGVRRRRRGAALECAVLSAAAAELLEAGYAGLTMDRVAARAGTNKTTIYRRWPSRAALAVAAYGHMVQEQEPPPGDQRRGPQRQALGWQRERPKQKVAMPPDTGTLRGDVLELLRRANRTWASPAGQVQRSLLAGVAADAELLALVRERANEGGSGVWLTILERAVARGEAGPEALHPRVATAAAVLLRNEYVTRGFPSAPDEVLVEIVDAVYLPLIRGRSVPRHLEAAGRDQEQSGPPLS